MRVLLRKHNTGYFDILPTFEIFYLNGQLEINIEWLKWGINIFKDKSMKGE